MSDALGDLETLRYEDRGGGVAVLRLHRPGRRNAWTLLMAHELDRACRAIDADGSIRVLVVTGSGDVFSVGADLTAGTILEPGDDEVGSLALHPMLPSAMDIPVIAAINGHAAGAGINFAMHCDLRILADSAKVAFPFVRRGVVPEMNMHWLLPRVVGSGVASDLLLTGRTVLADEALRLGVVHRILPADQILDDAIEAAQDMVRTTAPLGSSFTKQLLREAMFSTAEEAWQREIAAFARCAGHPDAVEGVISFLERREPTWTATREPLSSIDYPYRRDADHRQIDQQQATSRGDSMSRMGATVRINAKDGRGDELADVLARVRAEVMKEPGCELYTILRSWKQPDEFALVEIYRDRDALKAHQTNEALGPVSAPLGELTASMDIWFGEIADGQG